MYRGFELQINENQFLGNYNLFLKYGLNRYEKSKDKIRHSLDKFISPDESINGTQIQENWFPQIKSDIFICHSHKDKELAIALSQWLNVKFNLSVFVDSCIWGHAYDLLKLIDNKYCWIQKKKAYDYKKRNISTSHVYIMLATALAMMIDKTKCLFFLNTPNSIIIDDIIINKTESPWIYYELNLSKLIERTNNNISIGHRAFIQEMTIRHQVDTKHLAKIDVGILKRWLGASRPNSDNALNLLYEIVDNSI